MLGKWLLVLPLLVEFNKVTLQPITAGNKRDARQLDLGECCPCPDSTTYPGASGRSNDGFTTSQSTYCPCQLADAEASSSILMPTLRAIQPFVKQSEEKNEPKPLLQPEVGLASSVLETLRQATDEEYQDALARDAARSAVELIDSNLSSLDDLIEAPKNIVKIFLSPNGDDMDDNIPEPSHLQETRCVHSPLKNVQNIGRLRMKSPNTNFEDFGFPHNILKKPSSKSLLHKNVYDMDSAIGASAVQESVVKPNTDSKLDSVSLISKSKPLVWLRQDDVKEYDNSKEKTVQKFIPKVHSRLRDLIENLETNSNKERAKLPNLKTYFATTTRAPPLKLKPIDKPKTSNNNSLLLLNNLFKLKDVELIPPNLTNKLATKKSKPNLKLNTGSSRFKDLSLEINDENRIIECNNFATSINNDIGETSKSISTKINDAAVSSTNVKPAYVLKNSDDISHNINLPLSGECLSSSENTKINAASSKETHFEDQDNLDYEFNDIVKDQNNEGSLLNNNSRPTFKIQSSNENSSQGWIDNRIGKENSIDHDTLNDQSNDEACQIELVEDLQLPLTFDNSSSTSDLKNTHDIDDEEIQKNDSSMEYHDILNDPIPETSNQDLKFTKDSNNTPNTPEMSEGTPRDCYLKYDGEDNILNAEYNDTSVENPPFIDPLAAASNLDLQFSREHNSQLTSKNTPDDCYSNDKYSYHISDSISASQEDINLSRKNGHKLFSDVNEDSNNVSFKDLQEMSNSILILSKNESYIEKKLKQKMHKDAIDFDKANRPTLPSEENFKEMKEENASVRQANIDENSRSDEEEERYFCESSKAIDMNNNGKINTTFKELDTVNNEMTPEASNRDINVLRNTKTKSQSYRQVEDKNTASISTNSAAGITDLLQVDKKSDILDNLKSKFDRLFSTNKNLPKSDEMQIPEDNVNESSNIKPVLSLSDISKNLQLAPQLFGDTSPISGLNLKSYKNKLPIPNSMDKIINLDPALNSHLDLLNLPINAANTLNSIPTLEGLDFYNPQNLRSSLQNLIDIDDVGSTIRSNFQDFLSSPLKSLPLEDTLDLGLSFTDISNKLRSHAENAIHNVKETIDSRLSESQGIFNIPSEAIGTQEFLDNLSNRRDEINEKLQSIHSDFTDKLSSFQQSILDQINLPSNRHSEYQKDLHNNNVGLSNISLREQPKEKGKSLDKQNLDNTLPYRFKNSEDKKSIEKTLKLPKISNVFDASRFQNSDKLIQDLQQNIKNLGINNIRKDSQRLSNGDRKSSLQLPVLYSSTTAKPYFIPRQTTSKTKTNLGSRESGKLNTKTMSNAKQSSLTILNKEKDTKSSPFLRKPGPTSNLSEEPLSSSRHYASPSKINRHKETLETSTDEINPTDNLSTDSPVNKFRKAFLPRKTINKLNTDFMKKTSIHWSSPVNTDEEKNGNEKGKLLSRMREGEPRLRFHKTDDITAKNNQDLINSPSSFTDSVHSAARNKDNVKLIEPLKENVSYKCKLICYKDYDS